MPLKTSTPKPSDQSLEDFPQSRQLPTWSETSIMGHHATELHIVHCWLSGNPLKALETSESGSVTMSCPQYLAESQTILQKLICKATHSEAGNSALSRQPTKRKLMNFHGPGTEEVGEEGTKPGQFDVQTHSCTWQSGCTLCLHDANTWDFFETRVVLCWRMLASKSIVNRKQYYLGRSW